MSEANTLGELLRSLAFSWGDDYPAPRGDFTVNVGWEQSATLPPEAILRKLIVAAYDEPELLASIQHYHNPALGVSVLWYADGDCHLMFTHKNFLLQNTDAKKTSNWWLHENPVPQFVTEEENYSKRNSKHMM